MAQVGTPTAFLSVESLPGRRRTLTERVHSWLTTVSDALVSVIFPADCRICGELLLNSRRVPICPQCFASFDRIPAAVCEICGSPLSGIQLKADPPRLCSACHNKTYGFDCARSFAMYQGPLVRAILLLKFEQIEPLGRWFAERLAEW